MVLKLSDEQLVVFLRDEYLCLQTQYEDYDKRSLTIKGWVSTGALTALALAMNAAFPTSLVILLIVACVVLIAWYTETCWKMFQYGFADRIRIIEAFFREEREILIKDLRPFQIYHWWFKSYAQDMPIYAYEKNAGKKHRPKSFLRRFREVAFKQFVFWPYLPLLLICLLSFFYILYLR
jgi:hypothetical protein